MENKNSKRKNSHFLFFSMISAVLLIFLSVIVFLILVGREIRNNNTQYLIHDTERSADNIEFTLDEGISNIKMLSSVLSNSIDGPEFDISKYQKHIVNSAFDFVEFADKDGNDHTITGDITEAGDRMYYIDAMRGNTGVELIFDSRSTHENLLMFYSPLYYENEIIGSIVGVHRASERLSEILSVDYFDNPADAFLCDSDGRVFAGVSGADTSKVINICDVVNTDEKGRTRILNSLKSGKSIDFLCEGKKASGYIRSIRSYGIYLVQIYPSSVNSDMIIRSGLIGISLVAVLLAVFILLLFSVYLSSGNQQKVIESALNETREAKEKSEKHLSILRSVADIYYSMHLIDLQNNSAVEFESKNQVRDIFVSDSKAKADDLMHRVIHATMSDQYLETGLEFSEIATLKERMKQKKTISRDLLGRNVGWIRMSFIAIDTDDEGYPLNVVVTTQIIDDEKKREEKLVKESNTDELTGCFNRRAYEDDISKYSDRSDNENLVYVAMDINGLKVINDTLGHEAGDELILGASGCMKQCLGTYGRIYRTGGDEFAAIIFADEHVLEALKRDFEDVQKKWKGRLAESLAISSGFVSKREFPEMTVTEMSKTADKRMYEAKANYYKNKGVDRRGQAAAHTALCSLYTKILKINITDDTYSIVNIDPAEKTADKDFALTISEWLTGFGKSGYVFEDDKEEFLRKTDINYLREYFRTETTALSIFYRRKINDRFTQVVMEMIRADDYSDDRQSLFLYVKSINS